MQRRRKTRFVRLCRARTVIWESEERKFRAQIAPARRSSNPRRSHRRHRHRPTRSGFRKQRMTLQGKAIGLILVLCLLGIAARTVVVLTDPLRRSDAEVREWLVK